VRRARGTALLPADSTHSIEQRLLHMKYRFLFLFCSALAASPAIAADDDGNYAVWGQGKKACFHYNEARKDPEGMAMEGFSSYIMGYLTAYDTMTPKTYNIAGKMKLDDVLSWLDDYCGTQGMHSFDQAMIEFADKHFEDRSTYPPGRFRR
jgi:hypothetical protein